MNREGGDMIFIDLLHDRGEISFEQFQSRERKNPR